MEAPRGKVVGRVGVLDFEHVVELLLERLQREGVHRAGLTDADLRVVEADCRLAVPPELRRSGAKDVHWFVITYRVESIHMGLRGSGHKSDKVFAEMKRLYDQGL